KFEEVLIKKEIIKDANSVTITINCWTSCNNKGFIAVTAHFIDKNFQTKSILLEVSSFSGNHTSANLANELKRIISDWALDDNILLALSNNASNIKKATSDELRWKHLGCFSLANTINLIVQDALRLVDNLLSKYLLRSENQEYWNHVRDFCRKSKDISYQCFDNINLTKKRSHQVSNLPPASNTQTPEDEQENSILSSFRKKATTFIPPGTKTSRAIIEIRRYLEEPLLEDTKNPLDWWKMHAYNFPYLSELVKLKSGTVATSVPC
ncbi:hypothetical protein NQ314_011155, partial [Rhamnusium bicolor]